jgi:hypothetical protein
LIVKPHYWEKTNHGLHLKNSSKSATSEVQAISALNETQETLA